MKTNYFSTTSIIGLFLLLANFSFGQTNEPTIWFLNSDKLSMNDLILTSTTPLEDVTKILGEASKNVDYPNGETSYFFEPQGIVVMTKGGKVQGLGINFNWDGDDKFPETTFSGQLKLGEAEIKQDTKREVIEEIQVIEFTCPIPSMCATKDRNAKIKCSVAFMDEKITQLVFDLR